MIYNLQFLRALAAAMVVAHHLREGLAQALPQAETFVIGAAGVDIFFVLSGVVITIAMQQHNRTPAAFFMRRAIRVVPMYWIALTTVGLMLVAGLSPLGVQAADATFANMLRSMFFIPFERAHGAVMPLLGVGWTLNYEMFFYAIFAGIMVLAPEKRQLATIAVMISLALIGAVLKPSWIVVSFYTNPILLEFAAGVALAQLWGRSSGKGDRVIGGALLIAGISLLVLQATYEGFNHVSPYRALAFGVPAVLCVAGAMLLERGGLCLRAPFVILLGAASYALYLFHAIVLQCVDVLSRAAGLDDSSIPVALAIAGLGFVLSQVVAVVVHLRIEKPLTTLLSSAAPGVRTA